MSGDEQSVTYHGSPLKFVILATVAVIVFLILGQIAVWGNRAVPPQMREPFLRALVLYVPVAIIVLGVIGLCIGGWMFLGQKLTLAPDGVYYENNRGEWSANWSSLDIMTSGFEKRGVKRLTLLSAGTAVTLDSFFFPNLESILADLEYAQKEVKEGRIPVFEAKESGRASEEDADKSTAEESGEKEATKKISAEQQEKLENAMLAGIGAVFKRDHIKGTSFFGQAVRLLGDDPEGGPSPLDAALRLARQVACEERGASSPMEIERNTASLLIICFSRCPPERRKSTSRKAAVFAGALWIYAFLKQHCKEKNMEHHIDPINTSYTYLYDQAKEELGLNSEDELKQAGILPLPD